MNEISLEIECERVKLNLFKNEKIFLIMPAVLSPVITVYI